MFIVFGEDTENTEDADSLADAMIVVHKRFPDATHKGVWRAAEPQGWNSAYLEFFDGDDGQSAGMIVNDSDEPPEPDAFLCDEEELPQTQAERLQRVGDYLVGVLRESPKVEFRRFFDGTSETHDRLRRNIGVSEKGPRGQVVESLIDIAVARFEEMGFVTRAERDDELCDGERNYDIELTDAGKGWLVDGGHFYFDEPEG